MVEIMALLMFAGADQAYRNDLHAISKTLFREA